MQNRLTTMFFIITAMLLSGCIETGSEEGSDNTGNSTSTGYPSGTLPSVSFPPSPEATRSI